MNWGSFNWTAASSPGTNYYLSDGSDEIAEYNGSGTLTTRYVPGPAIDEPIARVNASGTTNYFHTNRQGSVIAMSGTSGALAEGPFTYSPYGVCSSGGAPCSTNGVPYRYTGRRFDPETGLYYYRARMYSPELGRFPQTDPVGYTADLNLYTYVGNDPTDETDPYGKQSCPQAPCEDIPLPSKEDRQSIAGAVQANETPNAETGGQRYVNQNGEGRNRVGSSAGRAVGGESGDFEQHIQHLPGEKLEIMSHTHLKSSNTDKLEAKKETKENNAPSKSDQAAMNGQKAALQTIGPNTTTTMYRLNSVDHLHLDSGDPSDLPDVSGQQIVVDPPDPH